MKTYIIDYSGLVVCLDSLCAEDCTKKEDCHNGKNGKDPKENPKKETCEKAPIQGSHTGREESRL